MKLELTHAALSDIRSIRAYTLERWGLAQEEHYIERLWERFEEIMKDPARLRSRQDLFPDCQIAAEGKHVILFRVRKDVLQIARVLHSAMDFKRHVPPDFLNDPAFGSSKSLRKEDSAEFVRRLREEWER